MNTSPPAQSPAENANSITITDFLDQKNIEDSIKTFVKNNLGVDTAKSIINYKDMFHNFGNSLKEYLWDNHADFEEFLDLDDTDLDEVLIAKLEDMKQTPVVELVEDVQVQVEAPIRPTSRNLGFERGMPAQDFLEKLKEKGWTIIPSRKKDIFHKVISPCKQYIIKVPTVISDHYKNMTTCRIRKVI